MSISALANLQPGNSEKENETLMPVANPFTMSQKTVKRRLD